MQHYLTPADWLLAAYLIGGIPFGFLIGKARGVDVRTVGSQNIGATNVFRTVGKKWGFLALFLDMMKGFVPTFLCKRYAADLSWLPLAGGATCADGHMLTPYTQFKGGKGVATGLGVIAMLMPLPSLIVFLVWLAIVMVTKYVSLGSCIAAALVPILSYAWGYPGAYTAFGVLAAAFIIIRHKANIVRLMNGTENKIHAGHRD